MDDWTLSKFVELVGRMRSAQLVFYSRRHEATDRQALLMDAIGLERQVDRAIEQITTRLPLFDHAGDHT